MLTSWEGACEPINLLWICEYHLLWFIFPFCEIRGESLFLEANVSHNALQNLEETTSRDSFFSLCHAQQTRRKREYSWSNRNSVLWKAKAICGTTSLRVTVLALFYESVKRGTKTVRLFLSFFGQNFHLNPLRCRCKNSKRFLNFRPPKLPRQSSANCYKTLESMKRSPNRIQMEIWAEKREDFLPAGYGVFWRHFPAVGYLDTR